MRPAALLLAASAAATAAALKLTQQPHAVCEEGSTLRFVWSGGKAPYVVDLGPKYHATDVKAKKLNLDMGSLKEPLVAGVPLVFTVTDKNGDIAQSEAISVAGGSCKADSGAARSAASASATASASVSGGASSGSSTSPNGSSAWVDGSTSSVGPSSAASQMSTAAAQSSEAFSSSITPSAASSLSSPTPVVFTVINPSSPLGLTSSNPVPDPTLSTDANPLASTTPSAPDTPYMPDADSTPAALAAPSLEPQHRGISNGAVAGIVIGVLAAVGLLTALLVVLRKRRLRRVPPAKREAGDYPPFAHLGAGGSTPVVSDPGAPRPRPAGAARDADPAGDEEMEWRTSYNEYGSRPLYEPAHGERVAMAQYSRPTGEYTSSGQEYIQAEGASRQQPSTYANTNRSSASVHSYNDPPLRP